MRTTSLDTVNKAFPASTRWSSPLAFENLIENRLERLIEAQLLLMQNRVQAVLKSNNPLDRQSTDLNAAVADFKDWALVILSRFSEPLMLERNPSLELHRASFVASHVYPENNRAKELLEYCRGALGYGEWADKDWFITELPKVISGIALKKSTLQVSSISTDSKYSFGEFQLNQLNLSMRQEIAGICQSRRIKPELHKSQVGFEFKVTEPNVHEMVAHKGSVLFTINYNQRIVGAFVLFLDDALLTPGGKEILHAYANRHNLNSGECGYAEIVVLDKAFAREMRKSGNWPYRDLTERMFETCALFGISHIVGEVRSDNLARYAHMNLGYSDTGLSRVKNGHRLRLFAQVNPLLRTADTHLGVKLSTVASHFDLSEFVANPQAVSRANQERPNIHADPAKAATYAQKILKDFGLDHAFNIHLYSGLSGDKAAVALQSQNLQSTIFQRRRGLDEWESAHSSDPHAPHFDTFESQFNATLNEALKMLYGRELLQFKRAKVRSPTRRE